MPLPRVRTFVVAVLIGGALMHGAWSAATAVLLSSRYQHRIFDVRRWPGPPRARNVAEMTSMFLTRTVPQSGARATVFFGSSVVFGFPWQEDVIVSARYAELRPAERVVNVSMIGADLLQMDSAILCGATNAALHAEIVIVEFPVINAVLQLVRDAFGPPVEHPVCDETIGRVSYASFFLRHPLGAAWLPFAWDDKAFFKPDRDLVIPKVYPGYFAANAEFNVVEAQYRQQVATVLNRAKRVGRRVYAFPSPAFLPGVREAGFDDESLLRQLNVALEECRRAGGVTCLDPTPYYTRRDLYFNLGHFNQRGHRSFAGWLAGEITPEK